MNRIFFSLTFLLLTCSLSAQDTPGLKEQIDNYFASGRIGANPVILVDGERVEGDLPDMEASAPFRITVMHKGEPKLLEKYGPAARDGVVMISTGSNIQKRKPDEGILCLMNGEPVAREVLENMNPDMIAAMKVVKDPAEIAKITDVPYKSVIIVNLKE